MALWVFYRHLLAGRWTALKLYTTVFPTLEHQRAELHCNCLLLNTTEDILVICLSLLNFTEMLQKMHYADQCDCCFTVWCVSVLILQHYWISQAAWISEAESSSYLSKIQGKEQTLNSGPFLCTCVIHVLLQLVKSIMHEPDCVSRLAKTESNKYSYRVPMTHSLPNISKFEIQKLRETHKQPLLSQVCWVNKWVKTQTPLWG